MLYKPKQPTFPPILGLCLLLLALAATLARPGHALAQSTSATPGASSSQNHPSSQNPPPSQSPASSSSQPGSPAREATDTRARTAQPEAGGSAITLETSEPLFDLAVALNACGYDADLEDSSPVRQAIRSDVNDALGASEPARSSRDAICAYIRQHTLTATGLDLAQYVSLAVYLTPPPALAPSVGETELPPDSTQVVNILPLLRTFTETLHLHAIWIRHKPEYDDLLARVHDPLTQAILGTNIYLRLPVSSYDGRRFLVLLEPMLAPSASNARIYGNDYIVVVSPLANPTGAVPMDKIRHTYLHYEVEPLVYARAAAMDRLLPLLKPVQQAPLDFTYKSDIVALLTECLIKAIEDRTMDVGIARPQKPDATRERAALERYDADNTIFNRKAEAVRRQVVDHQMRQGWVLVDYFYGQLAQMEKDGISLKEHIGDMIYGMDVERERHHDAQIAFLPEGSQDFVRRAPRTPTGLKLAELKMLQNDTDGAEEIAQKVLADPHGDHAGAHYVLAQIDLMHRQPEEAISHFEEVLKSSRDPRTLAWSHVYLGRLYDTQPDRPRAVAEYKAALTVRDSQPDTRAAAENGLKTPFATPKRERPTSAQENEKPLAGPDAPLDPSGKAEKDAYRPPSPR